MAKVHRNLITRGLNGSIGGQLTFVNRHGETIVKVKHQGKCIPPTQAQIEHRAAFGKAVRSASAQGLVGTAQQTWIRDFLRNTYPNANNEDATYD